MSDAACLQRQNISISIISIVRKHIEYKRRKKGQLFLVILVNDSTVNANHKETFKTNQCVIKNMISENWWHKTVGGESASEIMLLEKGFFLDRLEGF